MKSQPAPTSAGAVLDLAAIARELAADASITTVGHAARTILREPDLRVVVIAMQAGSTLAEHHAQDTASLQVLHGRVRVHLPDRVVPLAAGELLPLAGGLPHDVVADEPAAFVLTLAKRAT